MVKEMSTMEVMDFAKEIGFKKVFEKVKLEVDRVKRDKRIEKYYKEKKKNYLKT